MPNRCALQTDPAKRLLRRTRRALLLSIALAMSACGVPQGGTADSSFAKGSRPYTRADLGTLTYRAVDLILASAPEVSSSTPLVVTTIADVSNIEKSSPLGNIVSDMIRSRLVQDGRIVSEMRMRSAINLAQGEGEMALSRDRRALKPPPAAAAIITGTYAAGATSIYFSLKLISSSDARIISAADFVLSNDRDIIGLLTH